MITQYFSGRTPAADAAIPSLISRKGGQGASRCPTLHLPRDGSKTLLAADNARPGKTAPIKTIPKTNLAVQQWYQTNPDLYYDEVAAMRRMLNAPNLQPSFKKDGSMYWTVKCRPNIGAEFNTQTYTLELVYDYDHPKARYGTSIKAHPIDPTMQQLQNWVARIPGLMPRRIPHVLRDAAGHPYLCTAGVSQVSADLKNGLTSGATSFLLAYHWLCVFEGAIRDPEGLWKDFHDEGKV